MKTRVYTAGNAGTTDIDALDLAFRRELPAFWVQESEIGCSQTLVVVATDDSTPNWAFMRLDGFPIAGVRLQDVAQ